MAYVVAVCGSGGKTTLVKNLAAKYANENKKVCVTTTTHMWYDEDVKSSFVIGTDADDVGASLRARIRRGELCEPGKVYYIANVNKEKELITPLSEADYKLICETFDYVIIEADGSRSMPMKIPKIVKEPAIPDNVNEIIINVGMESIGREIAAVCHRFNEFYGNDKYLSENNIKPETIVTEKLIDEFVGHYYVEPMREKFGDVKVSVHKTIFGEGSHSSPVRSEDSQSVISTKKIAIVLCAAGFSKRFGSNKLMINVSDIVGANFRSPCKGELCEPAIESKKLYQFMIDKLLNAKEILINKFNKIHEVNNDKSSRSNCETSEKDLSNKSIDADVVVVSQNDEILNDKNYNDRVIMLKNDNASEGLSASIKLAVKFCEGSHSSPVREGSVNIRSYDAIVFVNADMPNLPEWELANFIYLSVLNKNGIAAMYTDDAKNPAYFEKKYFDELSKLEGDKGARDLLDKNIMNLYRYYINPKYLVDIDSKKDLELLNN